MEKLSDVEKYQCYECEYVTFYKSNLKQHEITHSKMYPYKCTSCIKGFTSKKKFDNHILNNHPKAEGVLISSKIHKCKFCNYQSIFVTSLKKHLKKHVKENNANNS